MVLQWWVSRCCFPWKIGSQIHFPKDTLICRAWWNAWIIEILHRIQFAVKQYPDAALDKGHHWYQYVVGVLPVFACSNITICNSWIWLGRKLICNRSRWRWQVVHMTEDLLEVLAIAFIDAYCILHPSLNIWHSNGAKLHSILWSSNCILRNNST